MRKQKKTQTVHNKHGYFSSSSTFQFDKEEREWKGVAEIKLVAAKRNVEMKELKIASLNVLFLIYEKEKKEREMHLTKRYPKIMENLRDLEADVIGLQEVTKEFSIMLLREDWVQKSYLTSVDPELSSSLEPYGQMILSKIPFKCIIHQLSNSKKLIAAELILNSQTMLVPVIHLTSSTEKQWKMDPKAVRKQQLEVVYERASSATSAIIIGDFNIGREEEFEDILRENYVDCWHKLKKEEEGFTLDPKRNTFVASHSSNGRRVDRILCRSNEWNPVAISLFGTEPFEYCDEYGEKKIMSISDHFGLVCSFFFN